MTCDLRLINEMKSIQPIPICLQNGTHALAGKHGKIALEEKGFLKMFYIFPSLIVTFYFWLSCIETCAMTFSDDSCVLKDCTLRTLIGVGEQRNGVHYYSGHRKSRIKQMQWYQDACGISALGTLPMKLCLFSLRVKGFLVI